jgi:PAS domain S-box-containing protein
MTPFDADRERPLRVLFIEDSEDDVVLILRHLRGQGIDPEYDRVESRAALEEALDAEEWDLILADYTLPRFSAPKALEVVKETGRDIPCIVVSGTIGEATAVELMRAGAHDFLLKDNLSRLVPAIDREIRDARERARRREAEESLRESEERFRQLAEHIDEVFWISTPDKEVIEYVSPAFREIWGVPPQELYDDSRLWLEHIHPDDRVRVREALPEQVEGTYDEEYRIDRPDGEVRWIRDRAFPIRDDEGEVHRVVGVAQDVTEREEAVRALEDMEKYYRSVMQHSADVVLVLEPDATIRQGSAAAEDLLGISPDELHGRNALELVHENDRARITERFEEVVSSPDGQARSSYRIIRSGGEVRHVEAVAQNLLHVPAVDGIVVNVRDITEQVELERQLRQSQKMEAIGRMAGGVAHDFNNLLTVVEGHADLLLEDLGSESDLREDAEEIRRASQRAAGLTRQLLAFARKQVLEPHTVDLNAAVRSVMEMLGRVLGEDVRVALDFTDDPLPVHVDPVQLEQVILNLALNAREAMPGGGRLTLRTSRDDRRGSVEDEEAPDGHWVLEVEDTGVGIAPEAREQIFEPFFSTKEEGSGLGLSTVYGIVEQSGGSLDVRSTVGEGSTFIVRLPRGGVDALEVTQEGADQFASEEAEAPAVGTILVVEDDDALRPLIKRILERWDFTVVAASTPREALDLLEQDGAGVELLLSDVVLPGMSGPELAAEARGRDPDLRFLFVSGYSDEAVAWSELPRQMRNFLAKPFTPDQLVEKVQGVLRHHPQPQK